MNRRGFLGALAALPFAGKAVEALAALKPVADWNTLPVGLMDCVTSTSVHGLSGSTTAMWRKIQGDMRDSFQFQTEEWDLIDDVPPEDFEMRR